MTAALKIKPKRKNAKAEVTDAYAAGADAAIAGAPANLNPFDTDTGDHRLWLDGWKSVTEDTTIE